MVVIYCYWQYRIWNGFYVLFQDTFLWIIEHYLFLSKQTKSFMLFQLLFLRECHCCWPKKKLLELHYICVFVCISNDNHIIMFHVTCNVQNAQMFERGMINSKITFMIFQFLIQNKWSDFCSFNLTKVFSPRNMQEKLENVIFWIKFFWCLNLEFVVIKLLPFVVLTLFQLISSKVY